MNERAALLRAICADPDDDTARLVYADWLEEHGEPERAAFIRGQIAGEASESGAEYRTIELGARLGAGWLAAIAGRPFDPAVDLGYRFGPFHHGFPFRVFAYWPDPFLADWPAIFHNAPITELELSCVLSLRDVEVPGIERLRELCIAPECEPTLLDVDTLRRLGEASPDLRLTITTELPPGGFEELRAVYGPRFRWRVTRG